MKIKHRLKANLQEDFITEKYKQQNTAVTKFVTAVKIISLKELLVHIS